MSSELTVELVFHLDSFLCGRISTEHFSKLILPFKGFDIRMDNFVGNIMDMLDTYT